MALGPVDVLKLQVLAKYLQLNESVIPFLYWYSTLPINIGGDMCYQLYFKGFIGIDLLIKKHSNLVHTERLNSGWAVVAFFKIPDYATY